LELDIKEIQGGKEDGFNVPDGLVGIYRPIIHI
jgi:hypothetical protein